MVTDGTLGSVRAMVALGCGLVKRGHKPVLVACPARFRALVEDYGLRWTAFNPAPLAPSRPFLVLLSPRPAPPFSSLLLALHLITVRNNYY